VKMIEVIPLDFDKTSIDEIDRTADYLNYPVIYILNGQKEAYIGETAFETETSRPEECGPNQSREA